MFATAATAADPALKDNKDKLSYGVGLSMGKNFKEQDVDINPDAVLKGLKDGLSGAQQKLTDDELKAAFMQVQQEISAKRQKANTDFVEANKKKPGVVTTATGLQYKILKAGTGPKPQAASVVKVHYRGTLINGTQFDSSLDGEPLVIPANRVIKGWTEALQLMPVGSKWQLVIPSDLAYGPTGTPDGSIPPNSPLVFEVELLSFEAPKQ